MASAMVVQHVPNRLPQPIYFRNDFETEVVLASVRVCTGSYQDRVDSVKQVRSIPHLHTLIVVSGVIL